MDVHWAVKTSQKLQKTSHGHHVQSLVVAVEEEEEDEDSLIEESSVSVLSMSDHHHELHHQYLVPVQDVDIELCAGNISVQ